MIQCRRLFSLPLGLSLLAWALPGEAQQPAEVSTGLANEGRVRPTPGTQSSMAAGQSIRNDLGAVSEEGLLKQGRALKARGGDTSVSADRKSLREARMVERSLRFGAFRSEGLADGAVSAPGIEDFATFFRASSSATAKQGASPELVRLGERDAAYMARQAEAEKLRTQTIASINTILATSPSPEQRLNLLLRLAEIHVESHSYLLELEIQTFKRSHDEWVKTGKGAQPKFSDKNSKARILAGIESLRTAANEFPNHQRTPEILFNLGFLLNQVGSDSARLYFEQLVTKFPKSDYVPKAYLALGEFHFQKTAFREALKNYQSVLQFKGTDSYNYAVYKIGWTYFNLPGKNAGEHRENLQKSLAAFQLVVKLADAPESSVMLKGLRGEALRDMVLVFVELKDIPAAQQFYASLGEQNLYFTFLERLAWQSTEAGEFDGAVQIYRRLIEEAPTHKRLPTFIGRLIEVQEKRVDYQAVLASLKFMSATLATTAPWHAANSRDKDALAERDEALQKAFNYWPKFLHAQAQKTQRPEYFQYALEAYQAHIQFAPQAATTYDSYFYAGEIFVHLKRHEEAATQYTRAVVLDESFKLGHKLTKDALLNAIASLDIVASESQPPELPEPGKATSVVPLPSLQARLVWCFDAFVRMFPENAQATALAHRAARYDYAFGNYVSSQERWLTLAKRAPKASEVADGIRMTLRVHVNRQDWKTARTVGATFLAAPGVKDAYVARDVVAVMKVAQFQLGLNEEKQQNHAAAEQMFLSYHKEYPDDADAPRALFNAAHNAFKDGKLESAVTHLRTMLSQYSRSDLVPDAQYQIASSMDALGQFSESAPYYEQLFQKYPQHKLAENAAFRAVQLRHALGQHDGAESLGRSFVTRWPNSKLAPDAWTLIVDAHMARSRFGLAMDSSLDAAKAFTAKHPHWAVYFYARAAQASEKAGRESDRAKHIALGLKTYEKLSKEAQDHPATLDGLAEVAKARLADAEKDFVRVTKLKITDGLKLSDQFSVIRADVDKVATQYVAIAKLGNAEAGIQSLYRVAELQGFLSATLLNAPVPKGASPDEAEQFRGTLERIALPLQEEASNLLLTAWQRAKETEAMTPFTAEIYRKLVELRPGDYRKLEARVPSPSYYGGRMVLNTQTRALIQK
jgi:TolA-binding protein